MQCDAVQGTAHMAVSVRRGLDIMDALRGTVSGLAIPTYVLDLPGGHGKVPLTRSTILGREGDVLVLRGPRGQRVRYADPSGEET
jgi:lysine 2,3-aminomutase